MLYNLRRVFTGDFLFWANNLYGFKLVKVYER
jgi:hypothetical protein